MRRFILQCNIERFELALRNETDPGAVARLREMLAGERRQLALFTSAEFGARGPTPIHMPPALPDPLEEAAFRDAFHAAEHPRILLDPGPGLKILDVNARTERVAGATRAQLVGRPFFETFPDNPTEVLADGVSNLAESLRIAAATLQPHAMPVQRYDLRDEDGVYRPRYWAPTNQPILDRVGRLLYLLHESREVDPPTG